MLISPINGFSYEGTDYSLKEIQNSFAAQAKEAITGIQYNVSQDPFGWRYKVG